MRTRDDIVSLAIGAERKRALPGLVAWVQEGMTCGRASASMVVQALLDAAIAAQTAGVPARDFLDELRRHQYHVVQGNTTTANRSREKRNGEKQRVTRSR